MRLLRLLLGRLAIFFTLLGLTAVLTGCVTVDRTLVVYDNGSGTYTLTVGFNEPQPGDPSSISKQIVTVMDAYGAHLQQQGGSYERYSQQNSVYWTYSASFASVSEGNSLLHEDPRQYDPSNIPVLFHDALTISKRVGSNMVSYQVTGVISLADPLGLSTTWRNASERLAITMANGVRNHQGGILTRNSVVYSIHYNQSASIDVTGNVTDMPGPNVPAVLRFLVTGILITLAVTLAGVGGWLLRGPNKKPRWQG